MDKGYDRYKSFRDDGEVNIVPFVKIEKSTSDLYITYDKSKMRMDLLSFKYYGDANFGWLILQANPEHGCFEFSIKDGVELRIPYPLNSAISRYDEGVAKSFGDKR